MDLKADFAQAGRSAVTATADLIQFQTDFAAFDIAAVRGEVNIVTDHPIREILFGGLGGRARSDLPSIAKNGHAIADLDDFM